MLLVNTTHPALKIYNPATGLFAEFVGGRLEIAEDSPDYAVVMAEAKRNAYISIHDKAIGCPDCGELFTGGAAKLDLGKHRKSIHFDKWLADQDARDAVERNRQIKARAGFVCDICAPVQEFGTEPDLAEHVRLLHANAPVLTESGDRVIGQESDEGFGGATTNTEIPAATLSGG